MNQDVFTMIARLHARLDDVEETVKEAPYALEGYAKRLDKIDDHLYLLLVDLEKLLSENPETAPVAESPSEAGSFNVVHGDKEAKEQALKEADPAGIGRVEVAEEADVSEHKSFLSPEMKENLVDAGRTLGGIMQDGKEVVSGITGTMNDLKEAFNFKPKK